MIFEGPSVSVPPGIGFILKENGVPGMVCVNSSDCACRLKPATTKQIANKYDLVMDRYKIKYAKILA